MIRMKATKPLTYRTRRLLADGTSEPTSSLKPGDIFEVVRPRDLKLLRATRKAELMREPVDIPAPPPAVAEKIKAVVAAAITDPPPVDDRVALRAEYEATLGKAPFPGWSAAVLREKIGAARDRV